MVEYNFPPRAGVGIIRTVKLAKYLPNYGWRPIILSVEISRDNMRFDYLEENEFREFRVYRTKELVPLKKMIKRDVHLGWSFSAFLKGFDIIKREGIDAIYASYPYATNLLAASILKRITNIPFLANYEDLWTNSFFPPPHIEFSVQKALEEFVLRSADEVVVVTPSYVKDIKRFFPFVSRISVVRNGFDPEDFESVIPVNFSKFTILHAGSVSGTRIPRFMKFLLALKDFRDAEDFQLVLLGYVDPLIRDIIKRVGLDRIVRIEKIEPHKEAIRWILGADVLLLVPAAEFIVPMKTYEYLASGRFVLNIGHNWGETGRLVSKYGVGISVIPKQKEIKKRIREIIYGDLLNQVNIERKGLEEFSWPRLAKRLALVLNHVVS